ncbi:MAG: NFACT RNA binding domain-containing protein, partial [Candidatus Bilamarchaeaceae archaeon]
SMQLDLSLRKSMHENASYYYDLAKEARQKAERIREKIEETKKKLAIREKALSKPKTQKAPSRKREWYEQFHWFFTSGNRLCIGGRSAQQNELLYSKHLEDRDLFYHADIQGASVVILKDGANASEDELREAAQFAVSFSKAWQSGFPSADVYCVKKAQTSKYAHGQYVAKGSFIITGERKWFKGMKLELRVGKGPHGVEAVPASSTVRLEDEMLLKPGAVQKQKIAQQAAKRFNIPVDEAVLVIPSGNSRVANSKI